MVIMIAFLGKHIFREITLMDRKPNNNQYLKTKVFTASQEELQMMLYDGAIRFCEQARVAIIDKKIEDSFVLIDKAEKIIMEMTNSMKDEVDPEIVGNMRRLYMFIYDRLVQANMKKDIKKLDEGLKILREMRETWRLLCEKVQEERNALELVGSEIQSAQNYGSDMVEKWPTLNVEG